MRWGDFKIARHAHFSLMDFWIRSKAQNGVHSSCKDAIMPVIHKKRKRRKIGFFLKVWLFILLLGFQVSPPCYVEAREDSLNGSHEEETSYFKRHLPKYVYESFTLKGSVVGYYQHYANATILDRGKAVDFTTCLSPQLRMTWRPIEQGALHARLRYTKNRVDLSQEGVVLANLLETNVSAKDNGSVRLQKLYYSQRFFGDRAFLAFGKTDAETFIDTNAYANDSRTQFMGQPLVDNPVLDDEDDYAPFVALGGRPVKHLQLVAIGQSSSWPMAEGGAGKTIWEGMLDHPYMAAQATYSPGFRGLEGNYRLYGWVQSYDHPKLTGDGYEKGWGIGLSLDQKVTDDVGLFARLGYQNEDVYEMPWFWSTGVQMTALLPGREADVFGLGISGIKANSDTPNTGTEIHLETYYRVRVSKYFFISPDLQYVMNPLGNTDATAIFAAMLRGTFRF